MLNPIAVAAKLRDVALAVEGVVAGTLGINAAPVTPAVEVYLETGSLEPETAGNLSHLDRQTHLVAFLVRQEKNLDSDETTVANLVTAFIEKMTAPEFDYTLEGLVEISQPVSFYFDAARRGPAAYRVGVVRVVSGSEL